MRNAAKVVVGVITALILLPLVFLVAPLVLWRKI